MTHLLRIHIGPVQEFIAAARRSRDLWFGSWLLSELSKAAARAIVESEDEGIDALVFPAPATAAELQPDSLLSVVNEIVAVIEGDPAVIAKAARAAVDARRDELIDDAFVTLRPILVKEKTWDVAEAQLKEFVEFYWTAVPLSDDYRAARALADQLLAARKNTRNFAKVDWGKTWPKSSLDGARESVIPDEDTGKANVMYERYKARRGEHLSGVDLLKRHGKIGDESRFPSTSHMAAMPLKKQLGESPTAAVAWQAYLNALPNDVKYVERVYHELTLPPLGDLDGSLLFTSRLLDHLEGEMLKEAEKALAAFFKAADIDEPNPYYAILVGDGDSMGKTINALETSDQNREFSRALAGFAEKAADVVREHDGAVVFAGGDDVLALLPLHTTVECAAKLAQIFAARMQGALAGLSDTEGKPIPPPTFSAGIAIVHHLEPLEDALNLARRTERETAKAVDGKNALAVVLDKRSGVPRMVAGHWGALDRRLLNFAFLHQDEVIPDRLAYQLLDVYHRLGGESALRDEAALRKVLGLETERIIERKRVAGGQGSVDVAHKAYVKEAIRHADTTVATVADELVIAALLARAGKSAGKSFEFITQEVTANDVAH